jgi:hypothetical protein
MPATRFNSPENSRELARRAILLLLLPLAPATPAG